MTLRRSHILRSLAGMVVVVLLAVACDTAANDAGLAALNTDRNANGLSSLALDQMLQTKAQMWAENLASQNTLYHSNLPDGITGCWRMLGENIGYGPSIAVIEAAYMNSPHHRANILNTQYTRSAVGVAWHGNTVFTVQEFMQPC